MIVHDILGGGFNCFSCSPLLGQCSSSSLSGFFNWHLVGWSSDIPEIEPKNSFVERQRKQKKKKLQRCREIIFWKGKMYTTLTPFEIQVLQVRTMYTTLKLWCLFVIYFRILIGSLDVLKDKVSGL